MDYKEKYEQGLECIQEILSSGQEKIKMTLLKERLLPFFPELKESEDEKIRKMIINHLGIYDIPKDCRAVILEGGRKVEIRKKKNLPLEPTEYRCFHCKHYVEGHTGLYYWSTMVCDAKPKVLSKAMEKRKANHKTYKDYTLYYAAQRYGKPCKMFELKEEKNEIQY